MNKLSAFISNLVAELDAGIADIPDPYSVVWTTEAIEITSQTIAKLKEYILKYGFKSADEEIAFFKSQKPALYAKLLYYKYIRKLILKQPVSHNGRKKYYEEEIAVLSLFFERKSDFITYYRSGDTYLDKKFFFRDASDPIETAGYNLICDTRFSTKFDFLTAKMIASEWLIKYLERAIAELTETGKENPPNANDDLNTLHWDGPVNGLAALVIACHAKKVFGNVSLYKVAIKCSKFFNVKLNHIHKIKEELALSKNPTAFIDACVLALKQALDQENERRL